MTDTYPPCCSCAKPAPSICDRCALPICEGCGITHEELGQVCSWCAPPEEEQVRIKEEPSDGA